MTEPSCPRCGRHHPGCTGHTKNGPNAGGPCRRPCKPGQVCPSHGGAAPQVRAARTRREQEAAAAAAVATLGLPVDVSPTEALLEEVRWTAGHVQWLRRQVQELHAAPTHTITDLRDGSDAGDGNPDGHGSLTWGTTKVKTGGEDSGTTQEAKPSIWYVLYENERKHLVAVCAAALKAGVEERRVRLAEQQGDLVATAIRRILDALNLSPDQQQLVGTVVPRELRLIAGGAP